MAQGLVRSPNSKSTMAFTVMAGFRMLRDKPRMVTPGMNSAKRLLWNETERRPRAAWRVSCFFLCIAVIANPLVLLLDTSGVPVLERALERPIAALATLIAAGAAARLFDGRGLSSFTGPIATLRWWKGVLVGFTIAALAMSFMFAALSAMALIRVQGGPYTVVPGASIAASILAVVVGYVAGSIFEEVIFRGFLLRTIAESLSARLGNSRALQVAWLTSSLMFGLLHLTNDGATLLGAMMLTVVGGVFGYPMIRSGSLSLSVGVHTGWNVFLNVVLGLPSSGRAPETALMSTEISEPVWLTGGGFGPEGGVVILLAAGLLAALCWRVAGHGDAALASRLAEPPSA